MVWYVAAMTTNDWFSQMRSHLDIEREKKCRIKTEIPQALRKKNKANAFILQRAIT